MEFEIELSFTLAPDSATTLLVPLLSSTAVVYALCTGVLLYYTEYEPRITWNMTRAMFGVAVGEEGVRPSCYLIDVRVVSSSRNNLVHRISSTQYEQLVHAL